MGTVHLAVDRRLGNSVALKATILHFDERMRGAFEREARLLASLQHPALPGVMDYFIENNGQYLIMEYIPGEDLSEMLARRGTAFSPGEVLNWADQLLDALDYMHTQLSPVIHRDIKPANLKLTKRGQIILLDFGLAKDMVKQPVEVGSTSKTVLGYSKYYAPLEQLQGQGTGPYSDLYSLGATLYHLLAGKPPVDVLSRVEAIAVGLPDPLTPVHDVNPEVPAAVAAVLHKAMAISRTYRLASADEMRKALRDARTAPAEGQSSATESEAPPQPEPLPAPEPVVVSAPSPLPAPVHVDKQPATNGDSVAIKVQSEAEVEALLRTQYPGVSVPPVGPSAGEEAVVPPTPGGQAAPTVPYLNPIPSTLPDSDDRLGPAEPEGEVGPEPEPEPEPEPVPPVVHDSGGKKPSRKLLLILGLAVGGVVILSLAAFAAWRLLPFRQVAHVVPTPTAAPTSVPVETPPPPPSPTPPATPKGTLLGGFDAPRKINKVAASPDGDKVVTVDDGNKVLLLSANGGGLLKELAGATKAGRSVAVSPDGETIAAGSDDASVRLWRVSDGRLVKTIPGHKQYVFLVGFSPDGQKLVSVGGDKLVQVVSLGNSTVLRTAKFKPEEIIIVVSPDQQKVAVLGPDGGVRVMSVGDNSLVSALEASGCEEPIGNFSPDGESLALGCKDGAVRLWRVSDGKLISTLRGPQRAVGDAAFSPDGKMLAAGWDDGTIRLWRVGDTDTVTTLGGSGKSVWSLAFVAGGRILVSGSGDKTVQLWQVAEE